MGYYTNFDIKIEKYKSAIDVNSTEFREMVVNRLNEISDYEFEIDLTIYSIKWYDWESDMKVLSTEFPSVLFVVDGNGEEDGDVWRAYFYAGKCQHEPAKIQFLPFDESKLK